MKQRLQNTKMVLLTFPLMIIVIGIPFVATWFLGDWLFTTPVWWLGIPVRILQWGFGAMMLGCIIYWIYSLFKSLVTGKDIYE